MRGASVTLEATLLCVCHFPFVRRQHGTLNNLLGGNAPSPWSRDKEGEHDKMSKESWVRSVDFLISSAQRITFVVHHICYIYIAHTHTHTQFYYYKKQFLHQMKETNFQTPETGRVLERIVWRRAARKKAETQPTCSNNQRRHNIKARRSLETRLHSPVFSSFIKGCE